MEKYQCLTIGINRYQFFSPLSYAVADAQGIHRFLRQEVNLPPQEMVLLTDTATYPSRENILKCLTSLGSGSRLWFFFSGYGINVDGDDYLLPIDGNPQNIVNTGIRISSLFTTLKQLDAQQTIVILDINRPIMGSHPVGKQTIKLAQQMGIALILSSQPEQFSYEVTGLGHGMLTSALLEALRHYRYAITLSLLDRYLQDRLSEYSALHWRPLQTPVVISPSLKASQEPLLVNRLQEIEERKTMKKENNVSFFVEKENSKLIGTLTLPKLPEPLLESPSVTTTFVPDLALTSIPITPPSEKPAPKLQFTTTRTANPSKSSKKVKKIYIWGGIIALLLGSITILLKLANFNFPFIRPTSHSLDRAKTYLAPQQASRFNQAIREARQFQADHPLYSEAQAHITRWSEGIFDIAQGRAKIGDLKGAIAAAQLIPVDRKTLYQLAQQKIAIWQNQIQQQQTHRILIDAAKDSIDPSQASSYNRGITLLSQIPAPSLEYAEAQALIEAWSQKIYLLAKKRAARGNLGLAIQTARLIPPNTSAYPLAQKAIRQWE